MTGARPTHLVKRGTVYYVRLPIPKDLQSRFQRNEIVRSFEVKCPTEARRTVHKISFEFVCLCTTLRSMNTKPSINAEELIQDFYGKLIATHDPLDPHRDHQHNELEDGVALQYRE